MTPFEPGLIPKEEVERVVAETLRDFAKRPQFYAALNMTTAAEIADYVRTHGADGHCWINDTYTVTVHDDIDPLPGWPALLHLSIKRNDRKPIHDWRDLQSIKNELVGPEHEAVELYPAESRLVDSANQYHLFVLREQGLRFPFGFTTRLVDDDTGESRAEQRPGSDWAARKSG